MGNGGWREHMGGDEIDKYKIAYCDAMIPFSPERKRPPAAGHLIRPA